MSRALEKVKRGRLFEIGQFHIDSALFFLKYGDDGCNDRSSAKYALGQKINVLFLDVLGLVGSQAFFFLTIVF